MPLDPQVQAVLDHFAQLPGPPIYTSEPAMVRRGMALQRQQSPVPPIPVAHLEDRMIPVTDGEIPIRIYAPSGRGPFPVLVFFHGGGFVFGNIESHDPICRALTNLAPCMVISVDYRLAPEVKFPTPVYDAFEAVQWIAEHHAELNVDPSRIAVGGDSAGGNLATVACHLAKNKGGPQIAFQVLIYPTTDFTADNQSRRDFDEGYLLDRKTAEWMRGHYLRTLEDENDPLASPALFKDFTNLPPALIITGEYDPLRDEGEAYGEQLRAAGVPVQITRYEGMIHGFVSMANVVDKGKAAIMETADALREAFAK